MWPFHLNNAQKPLWCSSACFIKALNTVDPTQIWSEPSTSATFREELRTPLTQHASVCLLLSDKAMAWWWALFFGIFLAPLVHWWSTFDKYALESTCSSICILIADICYFAGGVYFQFIHFVAVLKHAQWWLSAFCTLNVVTVFDIRIYYCIITAWLNH